MNGGAMIYPRACTAEGKALRKARAREATGAPTVAVHACGSFAPDLPPHLFNEDSSARVVRKQAVGWVGVEGFAGGAPARMIKIFFSTKIHFFSTSI